MEYKSNDIGYWGSSYIIPRWEKENSEYEQGRKT